MFVNCPAKPDTAKNCGRTSNHKAKTPFWIGDAQHQPPEGYYQERDDCHSEDHFPLRGSPRITRNSCVRATVGTMADFPGLVGQFAVVYGSRHRQSQSCGFSVVGSGNLGAVQRGKRNGWSCCHHRPVGFSPTSRLSRPDGPNVRTEKSPVLREGRNVGWQQEKGAGLAQETLCPKNRQSHCCRTVDT